MEKFEGTVRVSDVGEDYMMRYDSILYFFTDSSGANNFSTDHRKAAALVKAPYSFYLLGWQIEILRRPKLAERIWGNNWVHGISITDRETLSFRSVTLYDANDELCAYGIMTVVLVDSVTKKKLVLNPESMVGFDELAVSRPPLPIRQLPLELPFEPEQAQAMSSFPVRKSDIDIYHHVNNGKYVTMALEYLPDNFRPQRIRVQYKHAAKYGDTIYPKLTVSGNTCTVSLCSDQDKPFALVQFANA